MLVCSMVLAAALNLVPGEFDVVIAPKAPGAVRFAAEELTNFLSRAMGAPVPCREALELRRTSIVLGVNELSQDAGVDIASLAADGYRMKTKGNALYIAGRDYNRGITVSKNIWFLRGTLNGVYAFLEDFVGCRFYFPDELGEIVPHRDAIAVPELDKSDAPAMEERRYTVHHHADKWFAPEDPNMNRRINLNFLRLRLGSKQLISCHGLRQFKYVRRFAKDHPEYFCLQKNGERYLIDTEKKPFSKNGKLCYTSGVREEIYQDVKAYLTGQPPQSRGLDKWVSHMCWDNLYIGVHPEDGFWPCQCANCQAAYKKGDPSYASELIWGLTKEIAERLKAEGIPAILLQSAYSVWKRPPDFDLPPNISIDVATYGPWATKSDEELEKDLAKLRVWFEKVGHGLLNWTYPGKYGNFNTPRNEDVPQVTPHAYAKYYKAAAKYITGPNSGSYPETWTDRWMFDMLNYYVFSRLAWDPSVDVDAILDEHYRLMYGAAAPQMKEFFEILEDTWMNRILGKTVDTAVGPETITPSEVRIWTEIYSPARLAELAKIFEKAAAAVPAGSMEAKRIALMKCEFLDRMTARGRQVVDELSVEREKARRAANPPRSLIAGFKPVTVSADLSMTNKPFHAVKYPLDLKPGRNYRISYFVKGEKIAPYARRGGAQAIVWFNEAADKGKATPRIGFDGTFDWLHNAFEFRVPELKKDFKPELDLRLFQATGTATFDGLIVEEITPK